MWKEKTNQGRVVYDRKKNFFRCTDVLRILQGIRFNLEASEESYNCLLSAFEVVFSELERIGTGIEYELLYGLLAEYQERLAATRLPGSEMFGGGGATRIF